MSGMSAYAKNPFRGPDPLSEVNELFGRDQDLRLLQSQLISDRLLLLHSTSGCGKTSLVEAGLRRRLKAKDFILEPTISLKRTVGDDATLESLLSRLPIPIRAVVVNEDYGSEDWNNPDQLPDQLADKPKETEPLRFWFFDQFEEILADKTINEEERVRFFRDLGRRLEPRTVWALFAIREDYLGDLQPYLRYLPSQLSSRYRLTQLSVAQAAEALEMRSVVKREDGLEQVRAAFTPPAALVLAKNLARAAGIGEKEIVEPVHLQVVGRFLWDESARGANRPIDYLIGDGKLDEKMMSVDAALQAYYADSLKEVCGDEADTEYRLRKWFGRELIDRKGLQRLRVRVAENSSEVTFLQLSNLRNRYLIRDDVPSAPTPDRVVQLAHDRLIDPILKDNDRWLGPFEQLWQKKAAEYDELRLNTLLIHGADLDSALEWSRNNPGKVSKEDSLFLQASVAERTRVRKMRRLKETAAVATEVANTATAKAARTRSAAIYSALVAGLFAVAIFLFVGDKARNAKLDETRASDNAHASKIASDQAIISKNEAEQSKIQAEQERAAAQVQLATISREVANVVALSNNALKQSADAAKARDAAVLQTAMANGERDKAEADKDKIQMASNKASDVAKQTLAASNTAYQHAGKALELIRDAQDQLDPWLALSALDEAKQAGTKALDRNEGRENILERVTGGTIRLLTRLSLEKTVCLAGYVQSLGAVASTNQLVAIDETGRYYSNELPVSCDYSHTSPMPLVKGYPPASAIATIADIAALGSFDGSVALLTRGVDTKVTGLHMRQKVIALTLSDDGQYVGAANALWSVGVWRVDHTKAARLVRWPGNGWNPLVWLRWLKIYSSHDDKRTNVLAMHIEDSPSGNRVGFMIAGREDGCTTYNTIYDNRWHGSNATPLGKDCDKKSPVISLALSPDGKLLATGTRDGILRLWSLSGDQNQWKEPIEKSRSVILGRSFDARNKACESAVTSVTFMKSDVQMLAVGCQDGKIHVFDVSSHRFDSTADFTYPERYYLQSKIGSVTLLSFDTVTSRLYASGNSQYIEEWKTRDKQQSRVLKEIETDLDDLKKRAGEASDTAQTGPLIQKAIQHLCGSSSNLSKADICVAYQ